MRNGANKGVHHRDRKARDTHSQRGLTRGGHWHIYWVRDTKDVAYQASTGAWSHQGSVTGEPWSPHTGCSLTNLLQPQRQRDDKSCRLLRPALLPGARMPTKEPGETSPLSSLILLLIRANRNSISWETERKERDWDKYSEEAHCISYYPH